jgi:predicted TPR repeat methyltransferase
MTSADRVTQARSVQSPDDAIRLYRSWAAQYDHDVFEVLGFTGTHRVADLLAEHTPGQASGRDAPVIDLGCGTGVAGARLRELGFTTVDGIDISPEMLDVAARRGAYRHLLVADLTDAEQVATRRAEYAAAVSAGTFTTGHVGADALPAIVGLLRPGAVVAWVVAEVMWPAFEPVMTELGFEFVHVALEPIRRGGPPEAMMVVAILSARA